MKNNTVKFRVALTGAYGGIGTALAKQLFAEGADLYLIGRDAQKLARLESVLVGSSRPGQTVHSLVADLTDVGQIDAMVSELAERPPVNVLINNAGISHFGLFENTSDEVIEKMFSTNVMGVMRLTQRMLPIMKTQEHARIINIGSVFGSLAYPGFVAYSASKYALRGFSEALARELANSPIRVGHFTARATDTAINAASVVALNQALNTPIDSAEKVASQIIRFMSSEQLANKVAWPEAMFMRLNAVFPNLVTQALKKKLSIIEQFASV